VCVCVCNAKVCIYCNCYESFPAACLSVTVFTCAVRFLLLLCEHCLVTTKSIVIKKFIISDVLISMCMAEINLGSLLRIEYN